MTRAGGVAGLARRFLRDPSGFMTLLMRLVRARWSAGRRDIEQDYAEEVASLVIPRMVKLEAAFQPLAAADTRVRGRAVSGGEMVTAQLQHIYALIRSHGLRRVVETGVCNGLSSFVILSALQRNGGGHLTSIDLPEFSDETGSASQWSGKGGAVVPAGKQVGWLVDEALRGQWTLVLGASRDRLPDVMSAVHGELDLFVHDSEHSFDNQLFEFRTGFAGLRAGGYLLATDIQWSRAFDVFWREVRQDADRYFLDHASAVVIKCSSPR